jgi:hypothetical protein
MKPVSPFLSPLLLCGCLLLLIPVAYADTITVRVQNADTQDLFVTAYDMNTQNHDPVLSGVRINEGNYNDVSVTADGDGHGHITWVATRASQSNPGCGQGDSNGLSNLDRVDVVATGPCTDALKRRVLLSKSLRAKSAPLLGEIYFDNSTTTAIAVTFQAGPQAQSYKFHLEPKEKKTFHPRMTGVGSLLITVEDGSHEATTQTLTVAGKNIPQYITGVQAEYEVGSIHGKVQCVY